MIKQGHVITIDSSIKRGQYGEIVFIENGKKWRGSLSGKVYRFITNKTRLSVSINLFYHDTFDVVLKFKRTNKSLENGMLPLQVQKYARLHG